MLEKDTTSQRIDRRGLLKAGSAVLGGAGLAVVASSASAGASPGSPVIQGATNDAGATTTTLQSTGSPALAVVGSLEADSVTTPVVSLDVPGNPSLYVNPPPNGDGTLSAQILGREEYGGLSHSGSDALHVSAVGPGTALTVVGDDGGTDGPPYFYYGTAIDASSVGGTTIRATTSYGQVLVLSSTSSSGTADAVTVSYAGTSRAIYAESTASGNINGTITGVNDGRGIGVWGELRGSGAGIGVVGVAGSSGRGAQFTGGAAAMRLVPSAAGTHPKTGKVGDFFVDSTARLWFCTKSSTSTVSATWKQVTLT